MKNYTLRSILRFRRKYVKVETGCWLWLAGKTTAGYGTFFFHGDTYAHRFAWECLRGPIPDDLVIDHLCRVRFCVNPDHMELVTRGENVLRGSGYSARNARKTHCPQGHPYVWKNTYRCPKGFRYCRTCMRAKQRRYPIDIF